MSLTLILSHMAFIVLIAAAVAVVLLLSTQANGGDGNGSQDESLSIDLGGILSGIGSTIAGQDTPAFYASNAGFEGQDLVTAVAVAYAESGGIATKYNPETAAKGGTPQGFGSYGMWQIYLKMHPEFTGWNLFDPQTNANAAFSVYNAAGQSFRPWASYTPNGTYAAFMDRAQTEVDNLEVAA